MQVFASPFHRHRESFSKFNLGDSRRGSKGLRDIGLFNVMSDIDDCPTGHTADVLILLHKEHGLIIDLCRCILGYLFQSHSFHVMPSMGDRLGIDTWMINATVWKEGEGGRTIACFRDTVHKHPLSNACITLSKEFHQCVVNGLNRHKPNLEKKRSTLVSSCYSDEEHVCELYVDTTLHAFPSHFHLVFYSTLIVGMKMLWIGPDCERKKAEYIEQIGILIEGGLNLELISVSYDAFKHNDLVHGSLFLVHSMQEVADSHRFDYVFR